MTIPPEYIPPTPPEWATFCNDRTPKFKVHRIRAHALAALKVRHGYPRFNEGVLYHLEDGGWKEVSRLLP